MGKDITQGFNNNSPKHLDERYGVFSGGQTIPYASIADANLAYPSSYRGGKTVWIYLNSIPEEYWWRDGILDINLIPKNINGVVVIPPGITSWIVPAGTVIEMFWVIEEATIVFAVGTTIGGGEYIPPVEIPSGGDIIESKRAFATDTTIYFSGVTSITTIKIYKR